MNFDHRAVSLLARLNQRGYSAHLVGGCVRDALMGKAPHDYDVTTAAHPQQIKAAFEQSEKEVTDLHSRISQGMREAKRNGTHIGLPKGTTLTTKKSVECKAIIKKHSKDFGGSLDDPDVIKLCGCSRNSYYKYKKEIKTNIDCNQ